MSEPAKGRLMGWCSVCGKCNFIWRWYEPVEENQWMGAKYTNTSGELPLPSYNSHTRYSLYCDRSRFRHEANHPEKERIHVKECIYYMEGHSDTNPRLLQLIGRQIMQQQTSNTEKSVIANVTQNINTCNRNHFLNSNKLDLYLFTKSSAQSKITSEKFEWPLFCQLLNTTLPLSAFVLPVCTVLSVFLKWVLYNTTLRT